MKYIAIQLILFITINANCQELLLKINNAQISGNQITYDLSVANFDSITAMTYCFSYDESKLSFNRIKNLISFMSSADFTTQSPNYVCHIWIDPTLESVSLPDNTVLYRVVFNMLQGMDGDVCFSQEPYPSEFLVGEFELLTSFFIIDDCHPDTFEVVLTATHEIKSQDLGLKIQQLSTTTKIDFSLNAEQSLEFNLADIMGRQIQHFPKTNYPIGNNSIDLQKKPLPGLYILTTRIANQLVATKLIFQ